MSIIILTSMLACLQLSITMFMAIGMLSNHSLMDQSDSGKALSGAGLMDTLVFAAVFLLHFKVPGMVWSVGRSSTLLW